MARQAQGKKASWQVRSEFAERRYRRVDTRLWIDARVQSMSSTGKLVWMCLLTAPSTTSIPGLFRMREEEGAALCGLSVDGFRDGFLEPMGMGLVVADWKAGVVWVKKAARYEPPSGPNVIKNWRKVLRMEIPESPLVAVAMRQIREELQGVYSDMEPFNEAFAEAFPEGFMEPIHEEISSQDAGCRMQDAGHRMQDISSPSLLPQGDDVKEEMSASPLSARPREELRLEPPKAPQRRKAQAVEKPPVDPRHAPLTKELCEVHGWPHHGGRTGAAITRLLQLAEQTGHAGDAAPGEVLRRASIAKAQDGFPRVRELHELANNWGHFDSSYGPNHRSNPMSTAVSDWSEERKKHGEAPRTPSDAEIVEAMERARKAGAR